MVDWFGSCLTVKLYKQGMDKQYIQAVANAFFNLHIYANYTTNTIIIIGDAKAIDDAVTLIRNKLNGKILTSCYNMIDHPPFPSSVPGLSQEKENP